MISFLITFHRVLVNVLCHIPRSHDHDWFFSNEPHPVHPDRSITKHDYRGWPPL